MDGVSAATQVTTILSRYISSVKSVQSARTQLLDQIRLITDAETAIERVVLNAPCLFVAYVTDPQLQALIDEWSTGQVQEGTGDANDLARGASR